MSVSSSYEGHGRPQQPSHRPHSARPDQEAHWIGVDIGGTATKWMAITSDGQVVASGKFPTEHTNLSGSLRSLGAQLSADFPQARGIGVICPGIVNEEVGCVEYAANLDLAGLQPAVELSSVTGVPALLQHDGRAAGMAEGVLGAAQGARSFAMIPIGTGISTALFIGGQMWPGASYCAGEIGHSPIFPGGESCSCGQRGCLEVYASAKGLARRYREKTGNDIGARGVEERLGIDPIADEVWDTAAHALALAIVHLTLSVDIERIIIGGGLSQAGDVLLQPIRAYLTDMLQWRPAPLVLSAQLGEKAGLWGATILAVRAGGGESDIRWAR